VSAEACPGSAGDERGILHDAALDRKTLFIELPLKLLPDRRIFPGFGQAFPEQPDRRPVRNGLRIPEEMAERDPIRRLTLQFGIRQAIPLLEHQQFDHENDVIVRTTASTLGVRVEIRKKRAKGVPVNQIADLT